MYAQRLLQILVALQCIPGIFIAATVFNANTHDNLNPCIEWLLGYSGESCTETCSRESKVCSHEEVSEIIDPASFRLMVPLTHRVGHDISLPTATELCSGGVNTWPFATVPAVSSYQIHEKHEGDPSEKKISVHYNCFYPKKVVGDCDTALTLPPAQRFCSCLNDDCVARKRLRGKVTSKF